MTEESDSSGGQAVTVSADIYGTHVLVDCPPNSTLLSAFQTHGVEAPYACEEGTCGSCMCRVVKGRATLRHNEVLSPDELAEGYILACQAVPDTPEISVTYD